MRDSAGISTRSTGQVKLLTSCRLSVKFSCPQLLKHASSPLELSRGRGSPRASAPSTRHSCLCLRSSSSHSPARLASRRSLVRLRSTVTGNENARCMPLRSPGTIKNELFRFFLSFFVFSLSFFPFPPPSIFLIGPRFTRAFAGYKGPCCIPLLVIAGLPWSGMLSRTIYALYIFYFAAVKRGTRSPALCDQPRPERGRDTLPLPHTPSEPSLDARGLGGLVPSPLIHRSDASTSPILPHLGPGLMDYLKGPL